MKKYNFPEYPKRKGKTEHRKSKSEYIKIWFLVILWPQTTGIMGTLAFEYSVSLYKANAQKCGGVHIKIMRNRKNGKIEISPEAHAQPIIGGKAPAAPPITIF